MTLDEGQLIDQARAGDSAAFDDLVAPYRGELHAHCYRLLGSVHDADDAVQDALLGAWKGLAGFEGRSSLRGWLYRIATNAALKLAAAASQAAAVAGLRAADWLAAGPRRNGR